jgi:type IV pilus assembly protein PilO
MSRNFNSLGRWFGEPGPRRKVKIGLAALALFDLVFYLFAIGPLSESEREKRLLVESLRRQVSEQSGRVEKLAAIASKVETARTDGDKLLVEITLPRRTAFSAIVSEIDQASRQSSVELRERGFNVEPIEGSETLTMMTVTAGLEGTYDNLVRFLNLLDKSAKFLIIESLGAAPQQTGNLLSITLKLDAFVREET